MKRYLYLLSLTLPGSAWALGPADVAWLAPLGSFALAFGVVTVTFLFRYLQHKDLQTSVRLMVEKGVPIPIELLVPPQQESFQRDLRKGLVLTLAGIALPIALAISQPNDPDWAWGLIPFALGIAFLLSAYLGKKSSKKN